MPFGTLEAEFTGTAEKKPKIKIPKPEKRKREKPEPAASPPVLPPEPVTSASVMPEPVTSASVMPEPVMSAPPKIPEINKSATDTMDVRILSRNTAAAIDLLTGLYFDTGPIVSASGLSLYCDTRTLSVLQKNKGKLMGIFTRGDISYIQSCSDEGMPAGLNMIISPAGDQERGIKINFYISDMNAGYDGCEGCDVLWAIADAPLYDGEESYSAFLTSALSGASSCGKPVLVLMTQFEKYGKVSKTDGIFKAERNVIQSLLPVVRALSPDAEIVPIQLYGGLSYRRFESGSLVFGGNEYGGMLAYKPEGCHIPLLFSLDEASGTGKMLDDEIIRKIRQISRPQRAALFYGRQ